MGAAQQLGVSLAESGYDLMVYSSAARFIENDVVSGYLSVSPVRPGSVHVRPPYENPEVDFSGRADHPDAFNIRHDSGVDWEIAYYRSLRDSDGVVMLGGGRTALITAMIAQAFEIPLAPVAAFGGSARKAWSALERSSGISAVDRSALGETWDSSSAAKIVAALENQRAARATAAAQRAKRDSRLLTPTGPIVGSLLLILGLATIPVVYTGEGSAVRTLTGLIVGALCVAAAGAIIRAVIDGTRDWMRSAFLGMAAGAIAVLLFIAAQLATAPDLLSDPGARRLLFVVLAVASVAGLTFDAVYSKLRQQPVIDTSSLPGAAPDNTGAAIDTN
ncbi:hypothetical protein ACFVJ5_27760 [Nocardia sp. NPDC127606]|uniref:hypothetical protein n=1 Tax=Nocardia sp. NPDC127606 TaxID=3345406 RepID=UPI00363F649C